MPKTDAATNSRVLPERKIREQLQEIGRQLDRRQYPLIYNGGVVRPGDSTIDSPAPGEAVDHDSKRSRRSTTRSGKRTSRRQGPASRPGSSGRAPSLINTELRETYAAQLDELYSAYPGTKIWYQAEGLWLLTESIILPNLGKKATFFTALPYSDAWFQKSWGFWATSVSWEWIGPRHTNFPDGSICAFEPTDRTWMPGGNIVKLLDLYTLWALRHEHLRKLGRWPGHQYVPWVYERTEELQDEEFCGCGAERRYRDCCKNGDLAQSRLEASMRFLRFTGGNAIRSPNPEICSFMSIRKEPPRMDTVLGFL